MATIDLVLAMQIQALRINSMLWTKDHLEAQATDQLIFHTANAMRSRLNAAAEKGRTGWWIKNQCSIESLEMLMQKALGEKDMISVINYAAMIHARRLADASD